MASIALATLACVSVGLGAELPESSSKTKTTQPDKSSQHERIGPKSSEVGLEIASLYPPVRPALGLSYTHVMGAARLSLRLQGSWVSLSKTFSEAAQESSYASRLSNSNAQLTEINLAVPDLSYFFRDRYFVAMAPIVRATSCVAIYSTTNENSLQFESTGLSVGLNGTAGIRFGKRFKVEMATGIQLPISSIGTAAVAYTQSSANTTADFSDQELDSILSALQPYAKELSEGFTLQLGVRALWEI
jgi:hypothetical protein